MQKHKIHPNKPKPVRSSNTFAKNPARNYAMQLHTRDALIG